MASKVHAVKNDAAGYTFRCVLFAQSDNQIKSNPTLASGDWTISKDGGAFANLATLPDVDPDSTMQVKVVLSQAETNADEVVIIGKDASGAEWHSVCFVLHTVAAGYDSLSTLTTAQVNAEADTAISDAALATAATATAIKAKTDTIPASPAAVGSAMTLATNSITAAAVATDAVAEIQSGLATAAALQTVDDNVDAILTDTGTTLDTLIKDIPTVSEFEARTIVAANYFDPAADTVANVTTVGSVTTKTGYELAAGYDAAKTAASQTSVDDLPTNTELATALGTADDAVIAAIAALNNLSSVGAQAAAAAALAAYDAATGTDVNAATSGLPTATEIADAILSRGVGNVEDTADAHSLAAIVLATLESLMSGTTWTIYKTNGVTPFTTKTLTVDANADPVVGAA